MSLTVAWLCRDLGNGLRDFQSAAHVCDTGTKHSAYGDARRHISEEHGGERGADRFATQGERFLEKRSSP